MGRCGACVDESSSRPHLHGVALHISMNASQRPNLTDVQMASGQFVEILNWKGGDQIRGRHRARRARRHPKCTDLDVSRPGLRPIPLPHRAPSKRRCRLRRPYSDWSRYSHPLACPPARPSLNDVRPVALGTGPASALAITVGRLVSHIVRTSGCGKTTLLRLVGGLEFTVEAIFLPFAANSMSELEFETNFTWLRSERTRGWSARISTSSISSVLPNGNGSPRVNAQAQSGAGHLCVDFQLAAGGALAPRRRTEGIARLCGDRPTKAGYIIDGRRFGDKASPWSFSLVFVLSVAPM